MSRRRGLSLTAAALLLLAGLCRPAAGTMSVTGATLPPAPAPATWLADARGLATLLQNTPSLTAAARARFVARLTPIVVSLRAADAQRTAQDDDTALLSMLDAERASALAALTAMHARVDGDIQAFDDALAATLPVSATADSVAITATADITQARIGLQRDTANVALRVTADARVLGVLALSLRNVADAHRLTGHIDAVATGVHLALAAVLSDLRLVQQTDPAAVNAIRGRLGTDIDNALAGVDGNVIGRLDARNAQIRLDRSHRATREAALLVPAALRLVTLQRDVLARGSDALSPGDPQGAAARSALSAASAALSDAAAQEPILATAYGDLDALQTVQDSIDRQVRAARADIDTYLVQSEVELEGRLQSDVTLSISQTEETVRVHVDSIDSGAVSRVLDFDVATGMSVLGIAVLHVTVTPGTGATAGGSGAHIGGVDLLLQARLSGLQAHVHIDVAAVRSEQNTLRTRIQARIAALQQSLAQTVAPVVATRTATASAVRARIDADLSSALAHLLATNG